MHLSQSNFPKITLVTPSYNQGQFIEETILSVIDQQYPNLEYFIFDGGSTDSTISIIRKYESYLSYWISEKDGGQSDAIQKGLNMATGEIFNWLNSDDLLAKGALLRVAANFKKHPDAAMVYGSIYHFGLGTKPYLEVFPKTDLPYRYFYSFPYGQPAAFLKTEAVRSVGGVCTSFQFTMDYDLYIRLALKYKFVAIDDSLACFRWHDDSKSSTLGNIAELEKRKVFCGILEIVGHDSGLDLLKELSLFEMGRNYDQSKHFFKGKEIDLILFRFLEPYMVQRYINGDYNSVQIFLDYFTIHQPEFLAGVFWKRKRFLMKIPGWKQFVRWLQN